MDPSDHGEAKDVQNEGCVSRVTILAMVFNLGQSAAKRWQRIRGYRRLPEAIQGIRFIDGIANEQESQQEAA